MMRWLTLAAALGSILLLPRNAHADAATTPVVVQTKPPAPESTPRTDARLDLSELISDDNLTDPHVSYTQLRARLDAENPFGLGPTEVHFDSRLRQSWSDLSGDRREVTRLSFQYGHRTSPWMLSLGRQVIAPLAGTRVDGLYTGVRLGEATHAGLFAGLAPNPITGAIDSRFSTAGLAYDSRSATKHHLGGIGLQLFRGAPDRLFVSERAYLRFGDAWTLFALGVIDFLAPRGVLEEFGSGQKGGEFGLGGLDLTNAQVRLRYRDPQYFDVSLMGSHVHTLLPNRWWTERIQQERARRGFVVDGFEPVGTRRSGARLVANLRTGVGLTPYVVTRYDYRHAAEGNGLTRLPVDAAHGYEGRPGIKWRLPAGFVDLHYSYHRYFEVRNQRVSLSGGHDPIDGVSLDGGLTAMRSQPDGEPQPLWLFDVYGAVVARLGQFVPTLDGLDLMAQYQVFLEEDLTYQLFFLRVSYRFKQ